jgi:predicted metal-binding membrane protein
VVGLIALGMMNLALVFTAALIIFAEKTLPNSHRIARTLGVLMVAGGHSVVRADDVGWDAIRGDPRNGI